MLPLPTGEDARQQALLARTLKAIRKRRGLLAREVAARMGLASRTYEFFEAGGGRLNLARLQQFADVTGSDPLAILMSLVFGDPAFALRCLDNKLMTGAALALQDLNAETGDDLARLDARLIMSEFDAACARLAAEAHSRRGPGSERS